MKRTLVIGAAGQLGTELVAKLRDRYGTDSIVATDIREPEDWSEAGPAARLDCLDADAVVETVDRFDCDTVYHLAAVLSAAGEANPARAYRVNMTGLMNVLQVGARRSLRTARAETGDQRCRAAWSSSADTRASG